MAGQDSVKRCAIYTRKSTTNRLDAEMNSLAMQREVCSAYITSQKYKSWVELPGRYDDAGQSGSDLDRPGLSALMHDIEDGKIDAVVIYKVDRLTRSLVDFVRLIDLFEKRNITLVSISQAFDTSDSMGRMVLNILLTFSQFEREMIAERVRDSLRARKRHGKIHGGKPPFGYQVVADELVIDDNEAAIVRFIFSEFLRTERYIAVQRAVETHGFRSSTKPLRKGGTRGGKPVSPTIVHSVLQNPVYVGEIRGHDRNYPGRHMPIISRDTWNAAERLTRARRKAGPHAKNTSHFLAGLLRDGLGRPMYIDVQRKAGKVFTFYASVDAHWSRSQHIKAYRCNATRFDELVLAALGEFLCDRARVRPALKLLGIRGAELEKLSELGKSAAGRLARTPTDKVGDIVRALICEIELGLENVAIAVRAIELRRFLEWDDHSAFHARPRDWALSEARYEFSIEVRIPSAEKWPTLHIKPRAEDIDGRRDRSLICLIHAARQAQRLVDEHRELGVPELAKKQRMRASQFSRLIRVNYLAPDIVTAILDGTQPENLTRQKLLATNIPTDWGLQRRLLGFAVPRRDPLPGKHDGMWPRKP
ncbi:recombinase family protein [Porphyrobacter sp. YT40]|uniref:recombinase family protein n=1 Tax=Porphyrobacter sp. YT40 TaxID=2547601 RepID=UPI001143C31C|nr:recombinase family protein [Porphyrobacter sp. YT40]QDH33914.1 recombinase family protein [Porphyrobacter sp. YT40]